MAKSHLTVVPGSEPTSEMSDLYNLGRAPETTAERVQRLQHEARLLATEQVEALEKMLNQAAALALEIAKGGEAYPVGVREYCDRMAIDLPQRAQSVQTMLERSWAEGRR